MTDIDTIRRVAPADLGPARDLAHRAVQLTSKAARANLAAADDDSHANLGWDAGRGAFTSQPIAGPNGALIAAVSIADLSLRLIDDGRETAICALDGGTDTDAATWLDGQLRDRGLQPTAEIALPYELPAAVAAVDRYDIGGQADDLAALAAWYALAYDGLAGFAGRIGNLQPGPSPVRCWPHHFDIATYVGLETGDAETARGVGVGMTPGDDSYDEPYFYINAWPHLSADGLPAAPSPAHWHTQGFVGIIATAGEVLTMDDPAAGLGPFLDAAYEQSRRLLGL